MEKGIKINNDQRSEEQVNELGKEVIEEGSEISIESEDYNVIPNSEKVIDYLEVKSQQSVSQDEKVEDNKQEEKKEVALEVDLNKDKVVVETEKENDLIENHNSESQKDVQNDERFEED